MMNETGHGNRMITAFFDSRDDAELAIERLKTSGVPGDAIKLVPGSSDGSTGSGSTGSPQSGSMGSPQSGSSSGSTHSGSTTAEEPGFWAMLKELFMPEEDRHTYAEGLRRGGYLVTVHVDDAHYTRALDILDDEGTINLDEREQSWRSEGWAPGQSTAYGSPSGTGAMGGSEVGMGSAGGISGRTGAGSTPGMGSSSGMGRAESGVGSGIGTGTGAGTAGMSGMDSGMGRATSRDTSPTGTHTQTGREDEVIPVAEEQLRVGKREIEHGRVRVRSYTVEKPVQEQVNLREEHVNVERRPVDRAATGSEDAFRERTIEAEEKREVPVVNKEARVTEEVVLNKGVEQRNETVSETVRETKVEVEDDREGRRGTGTTGVPGRDKR